VLSFTLISSSDGTGLKFARKFLAENIWARDNGHQIPEHDIKIEARQKEKEAHQYHPTKRTHPSTTPKSGISISYARNK
jgi:hypothetical protein